MDVLFRERQQFSKHWLWLLLLPLVPVVTVVVTEGGRTTPGPVSAALALTLIVCAALAWMFWTAALTVEVTPAEIVVQFKPFHLRPRRIAIADVVDATARTYSPILEYGGWGIRIGVNGWAWNVSGNEGVQLTLTSGKRILIGSRKSAELEAAIRTARRG